MYLYSNLNNKLCQSNYYLNWIRKWYFWETGEWVVWRSSQIDWLNSGQSGGRNHLAEGAGKHISGRNRKFEIGNW